MSNSDSFREVAKNPADGALAIKVQPTEYTEDLKKCDELLTNIEAGFLAVMKDLMKKWGQPLTDHLKVILECSICKGLITTAVSRLCLHTFCSDCLTGWIASSNDSRNNCPICRNGLGPHVKNTVVDKVVQLLVDFSFTEKEKEERSNEIQQQQQLSTSRPTVEWFKFTSQNEQGEEVVVKLDTSIIGRRLCAMIANSLLSEMRVKFQSDINSKTIPDILLSLHMDMFMNDVESLPLVLGSLPKSVLRASFFE